MLRLALQEVTLSKRIAELEAAIATPAAVWTNMLRGTIAMPGQMAHLEERVQAQAQRIAELESEHLPECDIMDRPPEGIKKPCNCRRWRRVELDAAQRRIKELEEELRIESRSRSSEGSGGCVVAGE